MEQLIDSQIATGTFTGLYTPFEIVLNLAIAFAIGLVVAITYKYTHKGLSYSQSFLLTLVLMTPIVAMVMMVIGNSLARAFALVGALSIIRFRTVVKDTKDTIYIFLALAVGMAAGTSSYFLAFSGAAFVSLSAFMLHFTNFGSLYKTEFIVRFRSLSGDEEPSYSEVLSKMCKNNDLLNVEPAGDHSSSMLTWDIILKRNIEPINFTEALSECEGVSEVSLVASKHDADY
jgi:hypothetical protein